MHAMEISRTGLDVEWRRLEIIAANLANANTPIIGNVGGQTRHLVSGPQSDFSTRLQGQQDVAHLAGVGVVGVDEITNPPRLVHEPGNPDANAAGFVQYPAVDYAEQMTMLIKTSRAYECNIVAMNTARQMYSKALELGRRS
jgi:flagellar basal-body rod protein FlgC